MTFFAAVLVVLMLVPVGWLLNVGIGLGHGRFSELGHGHFYKWLKILCIRIFGMIVFVVVMLVMQ